MELGSLFWNGSQWYTNTESLHFPSFPGQEKNFKKYDHGKVDTLGLSYDYDSVMHYDRFLYSVDGKRPTIIARGKPWIRLGGQLKGTLTSNDVKEINELYDCD